MAEYLLLPWFHRFFKIRRASLRKLSPIGPYRQLDIVLDALPDQPTQECESHSGQCGFRDEAAVALWACALLKRPISFQRGVALRKGELPPSRLYKKVFAPER